jgi:inner membrane transporter RhtA
MAVLASVVPYTLELAAMRRAPRRVFGILLSLEPTVAALAGLLLLGQRIPLAALGGIAIVTLASAGATASARPPRSPAVDEEAARVLDDAEHSAERVLAPPVPAMSSARVA